MKRQLEWGRMMYLRREDLSARPIVHRPVSSEKEPISFAKTSPLT